MEAAGAGQVFAMTVPLVLVPLLGALALGVQVVTRRGGAEERGAALLLPVRPVLLRLLTLPSVQEAAPGAAEVVRHASTEPQGKEKGVAVEQEEMPETQVTQETRALMPTTQVLIV